jgi:DNA-binding SARP family transcriptional activator
MVGGMGELVEIHVLGRFSVRREGQEIPPSAFAGSLVRTFVRLLVARRGEFVSRDVLAESLWPRRLPADPAANLRVLVTRARRALGDPSLIVTSPGGYSFSTDESCVVDAEVFLSGVRSARTQLAAGQADAALRELQAALGAWGGEPLAEDAYDDWAQEYRRELARAHQQALEDAAEAALVSGDAPAAVAFAELAAAQEPLREATQVILARALAASGDSVRALRCLDAFTARLGEELGLEPSLEVRELGNRIVRGEPLAPPARISRAVIARPAFDDLAFVGRERELKALLGAVGDAAGATVVISAPAGMGKSRLLAEVAPRSPVPVLAARASSPEREVAWTLARSLVREALSLDMAAALGLPDRLAHALVDIVPDLEEFRPIHSGSVDAESRRALAFEAGVRVVGAAASLGMAVVVDDLQWADATSLTFLGLLRRRTPTLALVCAYRPEEVSSEGPAGAFLRELPGLGPAVVGLNLGPLAPEDITALVDDPQLAEAIAKETDASPLAVAEVVRALAREGALEPASDGRWRPRGATAVELGRELARAGQRRSIEDRAAREPPPRRELLSLLAIHGRETPARILATATGGNQAQVLDDLEALARAGLVRLGDAGWAPAHDLIGEMLDDGWTRPERFRLHGLLARALEAEGGDTADFARHLAGAGDQAAAAGAFATAAGQRLADFAADEALGLAEGGLSLRPPATTRSVLLQIRGEARALAGDLAGARNDLRAAADDNAAGPERARLLARLAMLTGGSADYTKAGELAELALSEAGGDPAARGEALVVAAILDINASRLDRGERRAAEALALFEQVGDGRGEASALDAQALGALFRGRLAEAAELFGRVSRLYRDVGKLLAAGTPRALRAWTLHFMGRAQEALSDVDEALSLEHMLGQIEGEAWCLCVRAYVLAQLERTEEAVDSATRSVDITTRLGHREWRASGLTALGLAHQAGGDLERAEAALRESLDAAEGIPFTLSIAAGYLASLLAGRGHLNAAALYADQAVAQGSPLSHYEPRLVQAEIAIGRGETGALRLAAEALAVAESGGYRASASRARLERILHDTDNVGAAPAEDAR